MSNLDSLLNAIPLDQVAKTLGVDESVARIAVETAVPTILAGLQHEASTDEGAGNLAEAVGSKDPSILDGLSLDQIDAADGAKILGHIFGGNTGHVTSAVAQQLSGADVLGSVLGSILSGGQRQAPAPAPSQPSDSAPGGVSGGALDDILGEVLGGGQAGGQTSGGAVEPNVGSELAKKLLPLLAPIILAWLAQQATQKGGQVTRGSGGLLQDILGSVLTGAGQGAGTRTSGSVVTDILGSILRSR
jgi:hypothetical protein